MRKVKEELGKSIQKRKEEQKSEEQLGWFSVLIDNALEKFSEVVAEAISKVHILSPEVKVPEVKVPEIKTPIIPPIQIPEIKIPNIIIPDIVIPEISCRI